MPILTRLIFYVKTVIKDFRFPKTDGPEIQTLRDEINHLKGERVNIGNPADTKTNKMKDGNIFSE